MCEQALTKIKHFDELRLKDILHLITILNKN